MDRDTLTRPLKRLIEPVAQIWLLLRESLTLRMVLLNRFTVLFVVIALVTVGAGAYMDANTGDRVTGTVVTEDGTPVENATVTVRVVGIEREITSTEAVTDGSGRFVVEDYSGSGDSGVDLRITVRTEDGFESGPHYRHTYFPAQTIDVRIQIDPDSPTT